MTEELDSVIPIKNVARRNESELVFGTSGLNTSGVLNDILPLRGRIHEVTDWCDKHILKANTKKLHLRGRVAHPLHPLPGSAPALHLSFGLLLPLYLGETPYHNITNQNLLGVLKAGYRMDQPQMCSDDM